MSGAEDTSGEPVASGSPTADDALTERRLDGEIAWQGKFLQLHRDRVSLPDGRTAHREYIVHPGAATVIPVFDDGRVLIERQFRYPLGRSFVEFPAGKIDRGEAPFSTACRELIEETGWRAGRMAHLTTIHNAIGYSDERIELYLATDLRRDVQRLDEGEFVQLEIVELDWLVDEVFAGRITDVKTQIGVLWLERLRAGRIPWPAFVDTDARSGGLSG